MIRYKINVLESLKQKGITSYSLRKDKIFSEGTIDKFRNKDTTITTKILDRLCLLLQCQPGDILEYIPDKE